MMIGHPWSIPRGGGQFTIPLRLICPLLEFPATLHHLTERCVNDNKTWCVYKHSIASSLLHIIAGIREAYASWRHRTCLVFTNLQQFVALGHTPMISGSDTLGNIVHAHTHRRTHAHGQHTVNIKLCYWFRMSNG